MAEKKIVPIVSSEEQIFEMLDRLNSGGGGGTYDGMEPRIAKLEALLEKLTSNPKVWSASASDILNAFESQ